MTIEEYISSILEANPVFVQQMNERVDNEYAAQIAETKATFATRLEAARETWIAKSGEEAYEANKGDIVDRIASSIPRYAYIKKVNLDNDVFEVEVDLLEGTWTISPV